MAPDTSIAILVTLMSYLPIQFSAMDVPRFVATVIRIVSDIFCGFGKNARLLLDVVLQNGQRDSRGLGLVPKKPIPSEKHETVYIPYLPSE